MVKKIKQISVNKYDVVLILATSFFLFIYAPLEIIINNIGEFWFGISSALAICISVCIVLFILLVVYFGLVKNKRLLGASRVILLSILLSTFLQGDFLNINFGVLNGADVEWKKYLGRMILDLVVWAVILIVVAYTYCKKKKLFQSIQLATAVLILGISIITISVLLIQCKASNKKATDSIVLTNDGLFDTTTNDNIVVFVLDMFDNDYMTQLLETKPDLYRELDGFVFFDNFSGTYSTTKYSMAHLYTGSMFNNFDSFDNMMQSASSQRLYTDLLTENGYKTYYYTDYNYFLPSRLINSANNKYIGEYEINSYKKLALRIYQLAGIKYLPNCVKPFILMDGTEFEEVKDCDGAELYSSKNSYLKENMSKKFSVSDEKTVRYIYMEGTHYPYLTNSNGDKQLFGNISSIECAEGVLSIVQSYINGLKAAGTYDNTAIIITADHGYYWDGTLRSPVLLVKPINSSGKLVVSHAPTCQRDWAATILDLVSIDDDSFGDSVFDIEEKDQRERLFYQYYLSEGEKDGNYRLIEYSIDPSGTEWSDFTLTDVDITEEGNHVAHKDNCVTCQKKDHEIFDKDYPRLKHEKSKSYPD